MLQTSGRFALVAVLCSVGFWACEKGEAPTAEPTSMPTKTAAAESQHEAGEDHDAHGKKATDRETVDADGVVRRGAPLSKDTPALTMAALTSDAAQHNGKVVKVEGKVESVCQAMGCWFVLEGQTPAQNVRITSKGHDVFVPRSAKGMIATVEGEFTVKTLDQKTAQHFEDERELKAGEAKKTFSGDVQELSLAVTSVEMRKPAT